jgi:hypothetical protein
MLVDRPPIAIGKNIMLHGMPPAVEHLVPGDRQPPTLSPTKTSKSIRIYLTKHQLAQDTIGTRHNKVGTIINHFVSQESKTKDEQVKIHNNQSGLRTLFIVV